MIFGIHLVISEHVDEYNNWADEREYAMVADKELGKPFIPFRSILKTS